MSIHTMGGVNYRTRLGIFLTWDEGDNPPVAYNDATPEQKEDLRVLPQSGWFCRWELPTLNGGPTPIQMRGEWQGPFGYEHEAISAGQLDFASIEEEPSEPVNTEFTNDR